MLSDLQAGDKVKLKIYANSTRRALWDAKLGFHRSSRPPVVSLHSLFADGGPVPAVDVVIMRIYPILVCITVAYKSIVSVCVGWLVGLCVCLVVNTSQVFFTIKRWCSKYDDICSYLCVLCFCEHSCN